MMKYMEKLSGSDPLHLQKNTTYTSTSLHLCDHSLLQALWSFTWIITVASKWSSNLKLLRGFSPCKGHKFKFLIASSLALFDTPPISLTSPHVPGSAKLILASRLYACSSPVSLHCPLSFLIEVLTEVSTQCFLERPSLTRGLPLPLGVKTAIAVVVTVIQWE